MNVGFAEALLVLRAWATDRALVRCELRFRVLAATFDARVLSVTDQELRLLSDDERSQLTLPLRSDFTCAYGDLRTALIGGHTYESNLLLLFPYAGDPTEADAIHLAKIIGIDAQGTTH